MSDITNYCPLCEQAAKERDAALAEAARHKAAVEKLLVRYQPCWYCQARQGCRLTLPPRYIQGTWGEFDAECADRRRKWAYGEDATGTVNTTTGGADENTQG